MNYIHLKPGDLPPRNSGRLAAIRGALRRASIRTCLGCGLAVGLKTAVWDDRTRGIACYVCGGRCLGKGQEWYAPGPQCSSSWLTQKYLE